MKKELNITIAEKDAGKRVDALAAEMCPEISRAKWQQYGSFLRDGKTLPGKTRVNEGDAWKFFFDRESSPEADSLEPWDFPLKTVKESNSWVVIQKPRDISVHPSPSDPSQKTVVNALIHNFANLSQKKDGEIIRPGLVHRLDKITSGVLLVAKSDAAHKYLQDHWAEVEKTYYAVVENKGQTLPAKGKIDAGITRDRNDRQKMTFSNEEKAKDAVTLFEVMQANKQYSLLKVQILTGRTHQIRVHLSAIGHPILGDEKYGGGKSDRVYLHATKLTFPDPDKKGEKVSAEWEPDESFWEKTN